LALDVGHLWGPSVKGSPYTSLAGIAIGLRAQTKYLYADIALGTPIYKPDNFETHQINPILQLTLNI
jgi:hemolysin activation/secretion protein